jgi:hypothetical protein
MNREPAGAQNWSGCCGAEIILLPLLEIESPTNKPTTHCYNIAKGIILFKNILSSPSGM